MDNDKNTYHLSEQVLAVETNGEYVLMDYGSGKFFGIRGAAQILVQPLQTGMTFDAMVDLVQRHYRVDAVLAETDVRKILSRLLDAGLVLDRGAPQ
ncbi:PqqD family protein [Terriglobus albidus]|uniref:PqqD family protein n=1 Tax=Terriglobus albidus TaxID=1592106 RepID=A0A5B9E3I3_9BACT|nr:PqqD family protein [Terriglobus albidus]QEE26812.1 PqqD family protein [Terriglobus albidus]